jgi:hypothetical protein
LCERGQISVVPAISFFLPVLFKPAAAVRLPLQRARMFWSTWLGKGSEPTAISATCCRSSWERQAFILAKVSRAMLLMRSGEEMCSSETGSEAAAVSPWKIRWISRRRCEIKHRIKNSAKEGSSFVERNALAAFSSSLTNSQSQRHHSRFANFVWVNHATE